VGRACGAYASRDGTPVVVVDRNAERLVDLPHFAVLGDVTDDEVLRKAGVMRARALVAALETDADNVYVTLSGRAIRPDLTIIARARTESSEPKLMRAGANHVVNPQRLGGDRMAAFAVQPHVMDFLDVVMHDGSLELRIEEAPVKAASEVAAQTLAAAQLLERTGAQLLAIRSTDGAWYSNPGPEFVLEPGSILIAIGTSAQVSAIKALAAGRPYRAGPTPPPARADDRAAARGKGPRTA
jgi:voltage-gated potassium channel